MKPLRLLPLAALAALLAPVPAWAADAKLAPELDVIPRDAAFFATVRVADLSLIGEVMARLRENPPTEVAGTAVERADDLAEGSEALPPTDGLRYHLADGSRVIVRPSGTEPKLKVYLEVVEPVENRDALRQARVAAGTRLAAIRASMQDLTSV